MPIGHRASPRRGRREGPGRIALQCERAARDGHTGARADGAIGFQALRGGTGGGDHTVILAGNGERIEMRHIAERSRAFRARRGEGRTLGLGAWPLGLLFHE